MVCEQVIVTAVSNQEDTHGGYGVRVEMQLNEGCSYHGRGRGRAGGGEHAPSVRAWEREVSATAAFTATTLGDVQVYEFLSTDSWQNIKHNCIYFNICGHVCVFC